MNRGRLKLLLMFAIFAAPFTSAWLVYKFWSPTSFANHGELVDPVALLGEVPVTLAGKTAAWGAQAELGGNWILLQTDSLPCLESCQTKLYAIRQTHAAMGKKQERVRKAFLLNEGQAANAAAIEALKDGLWIAGAALHSSLGASLPAGEAARDYIFIVDPLGNLFMRYHKNAEIKGIIRDLERVLKGSRIG